MSTDHETDVAIIGAGPVGLFAIFECGMLKLHAHVIDTLEAVGGQCTALYPEKPIYDIPGHPSILSETLIQQLAEQARPFAPVYHLDQQVTQLIRTEDERWRLETSKGVTITAKAVIIAAGVGAFGPSRPPLPGIETFEGKSIFYMVKHREAFRGQRVVIAGGGDSAVDWAISLSDIAARIMIVHRRAKFRAAPESAARLDRLAADGVIDLVAPYALDALEGENGQLKTVIVRNLDDDEERRLDADVLLPFFGLTMNLGPITKWNLEMQEDHIAVDPASCATNLPGVFAIGDIARYKGKLKLILTGFAEAALAAHSARTVIHPGEALHFEYSTTQGVPGVA